MTTLTWKPGSLLSYTSLWLTFRKLAYLNKIRFSDFSTGELSKLGTINARALNSVDLLALSRLMKEPLEAFSFCDSRFVPESWKFLFNPQNKFCATCMSLGYHTRLFSLKLLNRCPIHDEPLQNDCQCIGEEGENVKFSSLDSPYSCYCGRLMYFDPSRLHKNDHLLIDTNQLKPIVYWLESLCQIHVGSYMNASHNSIYTSYWLKRLCELSKSHDISYPSAFIRYQKPDNQWSYKIKSIVFKHDTVPSKLVKRSVFNFGHDVSNEVSVDVYKCFARHLRKHITRRTEFWINQFKSIAVPEEIAQLLKTNQEAKLAFTEMMWARCVEPSVYRRRWDNRVEYHISGDRYRCVFSKILADAAATLNLNIENNLQIKVKDWVRWHTFGLFCLAIWNQAEKLVEFFIKTNFAFWDPDLIDQRNLFNLTVSRFTKDNSVVLTFYANQPLSLPQRRGLSKEQRLLRFKTLYEERRKRYSNSCKGRCLSWSEGQGWHKAQYCELPEIWKLHKVMVKPGQVIEAALYKADEYYILRLLDFKLQVLSLQTSDIFDLMRLRFQEYCKLNNISFKKRVEEKIEVKIEPVLPQTEAMLLAKEELLQYKYRCKLETSHSGFCKSAIAVRFFTNVFYSKLKSNVFSEDRHLQ